MLKFSIVAHTFKTLRGMQLTMARKKQDNPEETRTESDDDLDEIVDSVLSNFQKMPAEVVKFL